MLRFRLGTDSLPIQPGEPERSESGHAATRFIPARLCHLTDRLAETFFSDTGPRRKLFYDLARLAEDLERHYASVKLRAAQELYAPYDPDAETVPPATVSPSDAVQSARLFESVREAFERANFERLPRSLFEAPRDVVGLKGARLDLGLDAIESFEVFVRGKGQKALALRPAKNWFRRVEVELPTYVRAAVAIRTRHDPHVTLKLYKDIAEPDVHLVLPTVKLKMRTLDKLTLSGSSGAALISAAKTLVIVGAWASHERPLPVQVLVLCLAVLLLGAVYGGKTVLDYTKIKASYLTLLAEHLHALTLASNRSVLTHLVELSSEEETKEVLVAYALLAVAGNAGLTPEALGARACAWIREHYACEVAFDVPDALAKLDELALARPGQAGARIALPLEEAVRRLDQTWDDLYTPGAPSELTDHVGI
jgi:hypothetical protein